MELISTTTVGAGGASSITFSSIPSTYTDLYLVISTRSLKTANADFLCIRLNSDSGTNYSSKQLEGYGSGVSNASTTTSTYWLTTMDADNATASTFGNVSAYLPNYAGSSAKTVSIDAIEENNLTTAYASIFAGKWSGTAVISTVTIFAVGANLAQYSTASLYGILKGSGGATAS